LLRIGLALGGGGARGAAHFGILKVLEEEGIPIDIIAGTSMGAIVGAMYAQNPDAAAVTERYEKFINSVDYGSLGLQDIAPSVQDSHILQKFARTIAQRIYISSMGSRSGIMKPEFLEKALEELLDRGNIQDTKIPFGAVATDLNSGSTLLMRKGSIRKAVRRSALIPGYLPPEQDGERLITDGAVSEPVPVGSAREMGAEVTIAVSVDPATGNPHRRPEHDQHYDALRYDPGDLHFQDTEGNGRCLHLSGPERNPLERVPFIRRVHQDGRRRGEEEDPRHP